MNKYNVLIIGAGNIGAFFDNPEDEKILTHAHTFYNSDLFNLVGFFDIDYEKAQKASIIWHCKAFKNLNEALNNIDVVCCAVPDEYHFEILKEIANYNVKFVFAEKPLTKTIKQAEQILDIYTKKNILIQINYTRRFLKEFQELKIYISKCGKLIKGNGYYGKGILHNGSHMIDIIQFLLGDIFSYKTNSKIYDFYKDDPSVDAELILDNSKIILQAIDCNIATIFELELFFENARIRIINSGFQIEIYEIQESSIFKGYKNFIKTQTINVDFNNAFINAANNIYNVLENNETILCSGYNAKNVLEICYKLKEGVI